MSSLPGHGRRRALIASIGGVALAAALFGAGFFTASALEDSDAEPTSPNVSTSTGATEPARLPLVTQPGATGPKTAAGDGVAPATGANIPAGFQSGEDAARGGASYGVGLLPYPFCQGDLPSIVNGSTIDLSRAGFNLGLLGEGYVLQGINVRAERECDKDGQPTGESVVVVDSTWVHSETGFQLYVTQRPHAEPLASVLTPYNGQAWADGYFYTAWVNAYPVKPLDDVARSPIDGPDPRGEAVLRDALRRLAPSVEGRCYYVQAKGSWQDLAGMGIGDPRPAIPSGLSEQYSEFIVFNAPPADCNAPALETGASFSASFSDGSGRQYVSVGAYPLGPGAQPGYGYLDEGSAYWTNDGYSFNVSGWSENGPIGRSTIEAIARAMDPDFSAACFITTRQLDASELAALGLRAPVPPDGFAIARSNLTVTEAPDAGSCGELPEAEYYPQYNLYWSLESDDATIDASAYRHPGSGAGTPGYIHEGGLNWSDANGTQYSVYGYSKGSGGPVDRETLIAVAQSMDPTLDPSTLQEGPVAIPFEKRMAE